MEVRAFVRMCVCVCVTFSPPHWLGFVESAEPQEISRDRETDLHPSPWEGYNAWDPAELWKGPRAVSGDQGDETERERERREG